MFAAVALRGQHNVVLAWVGKDVFRTARRRGCPVPKVPLKAVSVFRFAVVKEYLQRGTTCSDIARKVGNRLRGTDRYVVRHFVAARTIVYGQHYRDLEPLGAVSPCFVEVRGGVLLLRYAAIAKRPTVVPSARSGHRLVHERNSHIGILERRRDGRDGERCMRRSMYRNSMRLFAKAACLCTGYQFHGKDAIHIARVHERMRGVLFRIA